VLGGDQAGKIVALPGLEFVIVAIPILPVLSAATGLAEQQDSYRHPAKELGELKMSLSNGSSDIGMKSQPWATAGSVMTLNNGEFAGGLGADQTPSALRIPA
jgi:hypothetical protein